MKERFENKILLIPESTCWHWCGAKNSDGYGSFQVEGKTQGAHRVSYQLYIGEIPCGLCVCHSCDTRGCVNPAHMFLGSHRDNMRDMTAKNRKCYKFVTGSNNHLSNLTEADIATIRNKHKSGAYYYKDLAEEFGVSLSSIAKIVTRKTWRHL